MEAKNRLIQLYNYFDTNASKIEQLVREKDSNTKFSRQSLYNIESGKTKSISFKLATEIVKAFDKINIEWLLTGKGEMILSDTPKTTIKKNDGNSRVVNLEELNPVKAYIIPIKGRAGLQSNYYAEVMINDLEVEEGGILTTEKKFGTYFKIEVEGDSMYDGTDGGLKHGDWAYCRSVPKHYWRDKLHIHKYRIWCFFHNERGIIFKHVESHNPETGELELSSFNPDKQEYPNFKINIGECSYVCNVVKKLSAV